MFKNFFKIIIGVGLIIGGGILEIVWLSFLFGSVLGVVLVLIFAPHLLVMPWAMGLFAGMSFMASIDTDDNPTGEFEYVPEKSYSYIDNDEKPKRETEEIDFTYIKQNRTRSIEEAVINFNTPKELLCLKCMNNFVSIKGYCASCKTANFITDKL